MHKQPDNTYRIELQLGWDTDPEVEKLPERIIPRIEKVEGYSDFTLVRTSIYTFQCRRLRSFVQGQVIFAGDSAHVVSPFDARGGNSGLQDVDALGWRLAAVIKGSAPRTALAAYDRDRCFGADENLMNSSRSTRFMSPADGVERLFRDAVLHLAGRAGSVAPDALLGWGWMSDALGGGEFMLLALGCEAPQIPELATMTTEVNDLIRQRYLGEADHALYLIRPDQIIGARWVDATADDITAAHVAAWEGRT